MDLLGITNQLLRECGVGDTISTVAGLDENSDAARVVMAVQSAQKDLSRKIPMQALKRTGSINTVARVQLGITQFPDDPDGDGEQENGLIVLNGESEISGQSNNDLLVDVAWNGRLFHVLTTKSVYRVRDVNPALDNFQLADFSGTIVPWQEESKSLDANGNELLRAGVWDANASYPQGEIAQDRYLLPIDFKHPDDLNHFWGPGNVVLLSPRDFDAERYQGVANLWEIGNPKISTIREAIVSDGVVRYFVELFPIPKDTMILPFRYEAAATLMEVDSDHSGYQGEYEMALISRARWYVYRFIVKSLEDAQLEEATWRDIVGDAHKSPLTQVEQPQFEPAMGRSHWDTAYDG